VRNRKRAGSRGKLKQFARRFCEAAFRRPLSDEDYQRLIEKQFREAKAAEVAVKRVVIFTLKSPRFSIPNLPDAGKPDDYEVASRLARTCGTPSPTQSCSRPPQRGKLRTREQIAAQAARMLGDGRRRRSCNGFFSPTGWSSNAAEAISKDPQAFPGFDDHVLADCAHR